MTGTNAKGFHLLEAEEQLLLGVHLVYFLLLPSLHPPDELYCFSFLERCPLLGGLVGLEDSMGALGCDFPHPHFEVHSYEQDHQESIISGKGGHVLLLKEGNYYLDRRLQVPGSRECPVNEGLFELHSPQLLP